MTVPGVLHLNKSKHLTAESIDNEFILGSTKLDSIHLNISIIY